MSSTRGRLDITGGANIFRPDDSRLRHEVDADLTAVRYPQAGMRIVPDPRAAFAVVYRGEFQLALDLGAHLYGDISGLTTALYELRTHSINNFLPQQLVFGTSLEMVRDLKTTLDVTWINWSAYKAPVAELDVVLDIPPPPSGWPAGITPPETPARTRVEPIRMRDRFVPRVGLEWKAVSEHEVDGFLRAGYELAPSPIAEQTGLTNYVDRTRHTISFGLGAAVHSLPKEIPGTLRFDVHVQWSELVEDTTLKRSAADLVGDYTAKGRIVNLGATMSFAFDKPEKEKK
jgi:long-chain fatty acid transport protein